MEWKSFVCYYNSTDPVPNFTFLRLVVATDIKTEPECLMIKLTVIQTMAWKLHVNVI